MEIANQALPMNRRTFAFLLALESITMSGCVPMMAASAVGVVARGARGAPPSNSSLAPQAAAACTARAEPYGAVRVIDVEQDRVDQIIVWGTAGDGAARQSFECHFGTRVTSFRLRPIASR